MTKSLRFRLTATLILSSLFIGIAMTFFLFNVYQNRIDDEYKNIVVSLSNIVAHIIDGETVDRYLSTLEKDEEYERLLESLRLMGREFDVEYIVVSTFTEERETFIFDTDEVEGSRIDLGEYLMNSESEAVMKLLPLFLCGSRIEPYINHSAAWGVLYKTGEPIYRQDGSVAAYVFVSISMDHVLMERNTVFAVLGTAILLIVFISIMINLYVVRRYVIRPMRIIINDVSAYRPDAVTQLKSEPQNHSGDEFEILERAIIEKDILSVNYAEAKRHERELSAKTDFYRKMSHDLRTPLTLVSTNIQTAWRRPEEAYELLTKSQNEIMKMADMISDALKDGDKEAGE
jgi:hypothetical protein